MKTLVELNSQIKSEANHILYEQGLLTLLGSYGIAHVTGSYFLDLMTWRDLDIYLEVEKIKVDDFFLLGQRMNSMLEPVKMSFRNETIAKTIGLPLGLYWGTYLGNEHQGAWKIDVWMVGGSECTRLLEYAHDLARQIDDRKRQTILDIKSQCWQDSQYRLSYNSTDIYYAVISDGIRNILEFRNYLNKKRL